MIPIKVDLISYTGIGQDVRFTPELLAYTKSTRLEQGEETRNKISSMGNFELAKELEYMANTIPSSWEFVDYVFEIKNVTRAFTHQFVRTRTGSYAQQTMRMLDKKEFTYRIPPRLKAPGRELELEAYCNTMKRIQSAYDAMIAAGVEVEDARGVLPTNIHTNIIAKFNLRTMAEMAKSRTGVRTQDEYREVMEQMIEAVLAVHPWAGAFLSPPALKNVKTLESFVQEMFDAGHIDKTKFYDMNKACDKVRKGEA